MADNSYGIWIISFLLVGILGMAFLTTINDAISTTTTPTATTGETLANYGENTVTNTPLHAVTSVYTALTSTAYTDYIVTTASNLINLNTTQADTLELVAPHAEAAGYWSFNVNNSTNTVDDANGLNDGTVGGAAWTDTDCQHGGCYGFDGISNNISISDSSSLDYADEITILGWIKPKEGKTQTVAAEWQTAGTYSWLFLQVDGIPSLIISHDGTLQKQGTGVTNLTLNEWVFLAGIYNSTHVIIYVNGVQEGTPLATTGNIYDANINTYIGMEADSGSPFNGTIDEIRIYNRSLSAEEIKEQYDTYMNTSVYKADYTYEQSSYVQGTSSSLLWLIPTFLLLSLLVLFWRLADQGA